MRRSQGVRLRFVLRRMSASRLLLAGVLLVALLTTSFLAALADFAAGPLAAAAQRQVEASSAASVQVNSTASAAQAGQAGHLITVSLRSAFGQAGLRVESALWSDPLDLPRPARQGAAQIAEVATLDGFTGQARLSQGNWPAPPAAGQPYEVAAPAATARLLRLRVGQVLTLTDGDTGAKAQLRISGFFTARDPRSRYWGLDLLPPAGFSRQQGFRTYGPFVAAAGTFAAGQLPVGQRSWQAQPASAIPADGMRAEAARLSRAASVLDQSQGLGGIVVSTSLPQLLTSVAASFEVSGSLLAISGLELLIVALTATALAARLLAARRDEETALLMARGLTRAQVGLMSLAEALACCVIAAAAGVALGPVLAGVLAGSLHQSGQQAASPIAPGVLPAVLVAVLATAVLAWPGGGSASAAGLWARKNRPPSRGTATRAGADLAILALAGLMAWQLRQYSAVARSASGSLGIDPVLVAAPALILAAGALLPLRLLPALARLADRLAARGSKLVSALAAWELSRRPIRQAGPALLAVLAVSAGTLALSEYQSWHESALSQAAAVTGADIRIQAPLPAGSAGLPALLRGPDVTAAMPVTEFNGGIGGRVLAIDARTAARVVLLRADQSAVPASLLWDKIIPAGPEPGLAIPGRPSQIAVRMSVGRVRRDSQLGSVSLALSVQAADGVGYELDAGTIPPDGHQHTASAVVPAADRVSYPLRLLGLSLTYQMPPVPAAQAGPGSQPAAAAGPIAVTVSSLAAGSGSAGLRQFGPGHALAGWHLAATSAALAGNQDASGSQPAVLIQQPPAPGSLSLSLSPGDGGLVPAAGLPPLPITAAVTLTAAPVMRTVPGIATGSFLAANGDSVGATVVAADGNYNVGVHIVAEVASFPTAGQAGGLIVDQGAVQQLLASQSAPPLAVTSWWLSTTGGQVPAGLPAGTQLTSARLVAGSILGNPVTRAPQHAGLAMVAIVALLAVLGFAISVTASRSERRSRSALLAALGMPARSQARQLCLEQALLALPAAAAGLLIGTVAAHLLIPAVTLTAAAARPQPAALTYLPAGWAIGLAAAIAVIPVLAAAVTVASRPDPAAELRSAGTA